MTDPIIAEMRPSILSALQLGLLRKRLLYTVTNELIVRLTTVNFGVKASVLCILRIFQCDLSKKPFLKQLELARRMAREKANRALGISNASVRNLSDLSQGQLI